MDSTASSAMQPNNEENNKDVTAKEAAALLSAD